MEKIRAAAFAAGLGHRWTSVFRSLLLLSGIWGILLIIDAIQGVFFSVWVFGAAALICIGLFVLWSLGKKWLSLGLGILLFSYVMTAFACRERIFSQGEAVYRALVIASQEEVDVTSAVLFITVLLSVCFFILEVLFHTHLFPFLLVAAILAGAPFFSVSVGFTAALLCLLFEISFWIIHTADRATDQRPASDTKNKKLFSGSSSLYMAGALALLVCISIAVTSFWGSGLSDLVYRGEGFVTRSLQQITGRAEIPIVDGRVSRGNNYRTGEAQLRIQVEKQPEETLYLRGFSGGEYTGGNWEPADDRQIFRQIAQDLDWQEWESWIRSMFTSLYYDMNLRSVGESVPARSMFVQQVSGDYDMLYAPYYSSWMSLSALREAGYGFYYYERSEMDIQWPEEWTGGVGMEYSYVPEIWYKTVQDAYMRQIPAFYTQVPEDRLSRLSALCRENPLNSVDEVTAFILSLLQENTSYTLTPGRAPVNEDIVEYFLFDRHEGYCVHYASAATLIYRLYDIPARYVSGYAVSPSDFTLQDDGTWVAEVTDESSHAWTEIFIEDYGWTPVEVTPASDGSYSTSYPGLDSDRLAEMISAADFSLDSQTEDTAGEQTDLSRGAAETSSFSPEQYREFFLIILKVFAVLLLLSPVALVLRGKHRRDALTHMNCRQIFGRLMHMLHFAGYLRDYSGTEREFSRKLAEAVSGLSREESDRLVELVSRAAYGRQEPDKTETDFVRSVYLRVAESLYPEMRGLRKLGFRFIKGFC